MTVSEGQEGAGAGFSEKRTSFYLPSDCVKQIHISSTTTVREVIQGLLKKFMVQDNPRKFALYRQTHRDGQGELRTQITRIYIRIFTFCHLTESRFLKISDNMQTA